MFEHSEKLKRAQRLHSNLSTSQLHTGGGGEFFEGWVSLFRRAVNHGELTGHSGAHSSQCHQYFRNILLKECNTCHQDVFSKPSSFRKWDSWDRPEFEKLTAYQILSTEEMNKDTPIHTRNYWNYFTKNQTKCHVEFWTLKQKMETDNDHTTMRESL